MIISLRHVSVALPVSHLSPSWLTANPSQWTLPLLALLAHSKPIPMDVASSRPPGSQQTHTNGRCLFSPYWLTAIPSQWKLPLLALLAHSKPIPMDVASSRPPGSQQSHPNGSCLFSPSWLTANPYQWTLPLLGLLAHSKHIPMEVASSRPDHLATLSAAITSEPSLLVKLPFWWRSGRCRQCYSDFLLQCAGDIEADHTDSGIVMDCADRNSEASHFGS